MFTLKQDQPDFTVVDGPGQGSYRKGTAYKDVPDAYRDRFDEVPARSATGPLTGPAKGQRTHRRRKHA
jgi:hypothetical protein